MHTHAEFSFANGHTSTVTEKCRIWFPADPPCCTDVDICEQGKVPILFSVTQMQNLRLTVDLAPTSVLITCDSFDYNRTPAQISTSHHVGLNLRDFQKAPGNKSKGTTSSFMTDHEGQMWKTFGSNHITCPACNGRHRPHTYDEGCRLFGQRSAEAPTSS